MGFTFTCVTIDQSVITNKYQPGTLPDKETLTDNKKIECIEEMVLKTKNSAGFMMPSCPTYTLVPALGFPTIGI